MSIVKLCTAPAPEPAGKVTVPEAGAKSAASGPVAAQSTVTAAPTAWDNRTSNRADEPSLTTGDDPLRVTVARSSSTIVMVAGLMLEMPTALPATSMVLAPSSTGLSTVVTNNSPLPLSELAGMVTVFLVITL